MSETENLRIWSRVEKTDPKHTKKVTFGRGFTAIDPYYQIKCATAEFGPAGKGWGWEVVRVEEFRAIDSLGLLIRLWHGDRDQYIEQWGQGSFYTDNNKTKADHDVLKKATTDGITKCLSYLGFNADVFTGKFDDNKYVQQMNAEFSGQVSPEPIDQKKVDKAVVFFKKQIDIDNPEQTHEIIKAANNKLTNDEKIAVGNKMKDKAPDSNKMYSTLLREHVFYIPPPPNQDLQSVVE